MEVLSDKIEKKSKRNSKFYSFVIVFSRFDFFFFLKIHLSSYENNSYETDKFKRDAAHHHYSMQSSIICKSNFQPLNHQNTSQHISQQDCLLRILRFHHCNKNFPIKKRSEIFLWLIFSLNLVSYQNSIKRKLKNMLSSSPFMRCWKMLFSREMREEQEFWWNNNDSPSFWMFAWVQSQVDFDYSVIGWETKEKLIKSMSEQEKEMKRKLQTKKRIWKVIKSNDLFVHVFCTI